MTVKQLALLGLLAMLLFTLAAGAFVQQMSGLPAPGDSESALIHGGLVHDEPLAVFSDDQAEPLIITPYN